MGHKISTYSPALAMTAALVLAGCSGGSGNGGPITPDPDPAPGPMPATLKASYAGEIESDIKLPDFTVLEKNMSGERAQLRSDLRIDVDYDASRPAGSEADLSAEASNVTVTYGFDPGIDIGSGFNRLRVNDLTANIAYSGTLTDDNGLLDAENSRISFEQLEGTLTPNNASASWSGRFGIVSVNDREITEIPGLNPDALIPEELAARPSLTLEGSFNNDHSEISGTVGGAFFDDLPTIEDEVDGVFRVIILPEDE